MHFYSLDAPRVRTHEHHSLTSTLCTPIWIHHYGHMPASSRPCNCLKRRPFARKSLAAPKADRSSEPSSFSMHASASTLPQPLVLNKFTSWISMASAVAFRQVCRSNPCMWSDRKQGLSQRLGLKGSTSGGRERSDHWSC
jgi:hypothetical protein